MTDEEIIKTLAEFEGWVFSLIDEKSRFFGIHNRYRIHYGHEEDFVKLFAYLTSRDALAPVLEKFSDLQAERLVEKIRRDTPWVAIWHALILSPRNLARLVAEAIVEEREGR